MFGKKPPRIAPALVILPICQAFGLIEGRTLSVVSDMARSRPRAARIVLILSPGLTMHFALRL
jgi:hypothetical protein